MYILVTFSYLRFPISPKKQHQIPAYVLPNESEDLFNCMVSTLERDGGPLCCQNSTEVVSLRGQPTTEVFCAPM